MEDGLKILGFLAILIICILAIIASNECNNRQIKDWSSENGFEVVKCEECFFVTGPFWYKGEDDRIYCAVLRDKFEHERVSYFRIRPFFGMDQAWEGE